MAEKQTINQSNYGWYKSLEANGRYPIIAKRIFSTYEDALGFLDDPTAIPGVIIRVVDDDSDDNGAYIVLGSLGVGELDPELYLEKLATSEEVERTLEWLELDDSSDDAVTP